MFRIWLYPEEQTAKDFHDINFRPYIMLRSAYVKPHADTIGGNNYAI